MKSAFSGSISSDSSIRSERNVYDESVVQERSSSYTSTTID
ncbi:MAG: hypothetical protein WAL66_03025 [Nitrososphaeraceae archaeon]